MEDQQMNYVALLNEFCQKHRCAVNYKLLASDGPDHIKTFTMVAELNGKTYPPGVGKNKKDAKQQAAKNAYVVIKKEEDTSATNSVPEENGTSSQSLSHLSSSLAHLSISSPSTTRGTDSNFIGDLNHHCQKTNQVWDFKKVAKEGPAHDSEFVCKVIINKKEYPEGKGKSLKEAKQRAAQLALKELQTSATATGSEDESSLKSSRNNVHSAMSTPQGQSSSGGITFRASPSDQNLIPPVKQASPAAVKPKRKLAVNFQISPDGRKEVNKPEPPPVSTQIPKSRFLNEFDTIEPIGKGGFGHVYKARLKIDKKFYAVKIVKFTDKALREVDALAELSHPNIVRYHTSWTEETAYRHDSSDSSSLTNFDSGSASKYIYIQMEFCERTLRAWINEQNSQDKNSQNRRQEATQIMKQVLKAVEHVHSKNLIHRDLKPLNIMFDGDGVVKVGDFGLVTAAEQDSDGVLMERTKTGTRSYMSPEQKNQSSYDRKVDIFPLGLIFFELLWCLGTGHEKQTIWKNIQERSFPKEFEERFIFEYKLIFRMVSEDPKERPDAAELLKELDIYMSVMQTDRRAERENRTY